MPSLDWTAFDSLPGSKSKNFEDLCRGLMRLHYGQFGQFKALSNQPGVEFHINLTSTCSLGQHPRWFGWQCKFHTRTQRSELTAASKIDIEQSLRTTESVLPGITDWILWTPYTLCKSDQEWFHSIITTMTLQLWSEEELDTYLNGDGLILRHTYFGELIVTPKELELRHRESIQPIRERWLEPVHQSVDAERTIRRMLGDSDSWSQMKDLGRELKKVADIISKNAVVDSTQIEKTITPFVAACSAFADTLMRFHEIIADGDLEIIQQKLSERKTLINTQVCATPRRLRTWKLPIALEATNALDDMRIAQGLLDKAEEFLGVGLVAVLADAGGGKTQMAAQLTAPQIARPAGILLHGRNLHRGQTLDDLAHHFSINANPLTSMERLLASLDSAGKRAKCRLPVIIDGLNEAENPRDWKVLLASLSETIKRYPNVLVVCTLRTGEHRRDDQVRRQQSQAGDRESFAVMALPKTVRKIESEGFGEDTQEAIAKYFKYYKINPGDAELPLGFLQHPLTLRIFCEVTNQKRESEVRIAYFPASLTPLLEKYIANACERISQMINLSYSYSSEELSLAVYKLGNELWKGKQREISDANYRTVVSDTARPWDSSIVNLLAQEGIVFKNPGSTPGEFVITPTYDALGGYIIANALLVENANDRTFEWLKRQEVIESFSGDNSHQLAFDIFKSLVALVPRRMHSKQLWKEVPELFRNAALGLVTALDAEYLDNETVTALLELLRDNPKERTRLFPRLQGVRGATNYPFNAGFLDSALRSIPVSERDLSWTEWIRANRSEIFNDLLAIELRWKEALAVRTPSDRLRAKWVMWLLTSTDRELRDIATRALYWFGRGDPSSLFEESIGSLSIDDPYVPERMLAASYGVAMARHVDIGNQIFVSEILPKFARNLYSAMFAEEAPSSTTHILMREYATGIITMASMHNPKRFSLEEMQRSKPPFIDGGCREWGASETSEEERHGINSPFHMDFENYTIGSLVPNRGNYDYKHSEYRKVRAQILWRIERLGWSNEIFKDIDHSIANKHHWPRTGRDAQKTDRYGKKYSWIAYFEMSGFLHDQGVLKNWRERTSSVDIDPSFPERVTKGSLIDADILGDPKMEMKEWIANGPLPKIDPYLQLREVQQVEGPWVALDGYVVQQDETRGRKSFCFIRSFLISKQDVDSFYEHLSRQDLGGRWLPEKPENIYTFAGEIPWCDTFPNNGLSEFSFVTKEEILKVQKTKQEYYLDGERLNLSSVDLVLIRKFGNTFENTEKQKQMSEEDFERIEIRDVPVEIEEIKKEYKNINTLIPVCDFGWEGYQTVASDAGHAIALAKGISSDLELIGQPQSFDLYTIDGKKATFNIFSENRDINNLHKFSFIKEDLLKNYLKKNNLALVWAIWGEREYSLGQIEKIFHGPNRPEQTYAVFSYIKRK